MEPDQLDVEAIAAETRTNLSNMIEGGQLHDAMELAAAARAAFPQDAGFAATQAFIHLRLGWSDKAAQFAGEALDLGSDDPEVAVILGHAHRNRGRHEPAAQAFLVANRWLPARADIARLAIEEAGLAGGLEGVRAVFNEVYGRTPDRTIATAWAKQVFAAGLDAEVPQVALSAPAMSARDWLARRGEAPDFTGDLEVMPVESPPIYGEPDLPRPRTNVLGYTPYACTLRDATVFAKSSLILTSDGAVVNDTVADPRYGRFLDLPHDRLVLARRDDRLLLDVGARPVREMDGAVMLSGWVSEHFGHWVPEYLCRLAYLERHPRFADLPLLVDDDMPPQHLEYLRLLVTNPVVAIPTETAFRVGELVTASPSTFFPVHLTADHTVPPENQGGLPVGGFRYLQQRVLERLPPSGARGRRLYLSRRSRTWRRLENEEAISEALAGQGFEVLFPEDMSLADQVRMYQEASLVVAPNGSSLLNAIFAPTDLKLIVLSQRGLYNWGTFYGLMSELGYDLTFLCGDDDMGLKHANYSVPIPRLLQAVAEYSA